MLAIVVGLVAVALASPIGQELFSLAQSSGPFSADNIAAGIALLFILLLIASARHFWNEDVKKSSASYDKTS
jgi:hypothetical protein